MIIKRPAVVVSFQRIFPAVETCERVIKKMPTFLQYLKIKWKLKKTSREYFTPGINLLECVFHSNDERSYLANKSRLSPLISPIRSRVCSGADSSLMWWGQLSAVWSCIHVHVTSSWLIDLSRSITSHPPSLVCLFLCTHTHAHTLHVSCACRHLCSAPHYPLI